MDRLRITKKRVLWSRATLVFGWLMPAVGRPRNAAAAAGVSMLKSSDASTAAAFVDSPLFANKACAALVVTTLAAVSSVVRLATSESGAGAGATAGGALNDGAGVAAAGAAAGAAACAATGAATGAAAGAATGAATGAAAGAAGAAAGAGAEAGVGTAPATGVGTAAGADRVLEVRGGMERCPVSAEGAVRESTARWSEGEETVRFDEWALCLATARRLGTGGAPSPRDNEGGAPSALAAGGPAARLVLLWAPWSARLLSGCDPVGAVGATVAAAGAIVSSGASPS